MLTGLNSDRPAAPPRPDACHALLVYPRFNPHSFWNYQETCEMAGAKYPATPLGLITVAAMLPASWTLKLVDCNTEALDRPRPRLGRPGPHRRHAAAAARHAAFD